MSSKIENETNYITLKSKDVRYMTIKGYVLTVTQSESKMYHTVVFDPVKYIQYGREDFKSFDNDIKNPLKKIYKNAVLSLTTDEELLQSYKQHGLHVFFPKNESGSMKCWAWHSKVGDPNDCLQKVCSAEVKVKQITVITKKENNVVTHTILPKFEINGSIKKLDEKPPLPKPEEDEEEKEKVAVSDDDDDEEESQETQPVELNTKAVKRGNSDSDNNTTTTNKKNRKN